MLAIMTAICENVTIARLFLNYVRYVNSGSFYYIYIIVYNFYIYFAFF